MLAVDILPFISQIYFCHRKCVHALELQKKYWTNATGYGGHYGPAFVTYFDEQNAKIDAGQLQAEKVTVSALMINKYEKIILVFPWITDILKAGGMTLSSNIG